MQVSSCQDYDCVSLSFFFFEHSVSLKMLSICIWSSGKSLSNLCSLSLKSTKGDLVKLIKSRPSGEFKEENIFVKKKPTKQKKKQELIILLSSFWVASFIKCSFFIRFYEYYFTFAVGFLENVSSKGRDFSFPLLSVVSVVMSQNITLRLQSWPICRLQVFFLQSWNKFCKSLTTIRSDQLVPSLELLPPCVVSDYLFWVIMA